MSEATAFGAEAVSIATEILDELGGDVTFEHRVGVETKTTTTKAVVNTFDEFDREATTVGENEESYLVKGEGMDFELKSSMIMLVGQSRLVVRRVSSVRVAPEDPVAYYEIVVGS